MQQGMSESKLRELALREHSEAVEAYCATLASIGNALDLDLEPSPKQLERAREAKLRLENARTFLQLSAVEDADEAEPSTGGQQRGHHVH